MWLIQLNGENYLCEGINNGKSMEVHVSMLPYHNYFAEVAFDRKQYKIQVD